MPGRLSSKTGFFIVRWEIFDPFAPAVASLDSSEKSDAGAGIVAGV
jgi:hypothetical protein